MKLFARKWVWLFPVAVIFAVSFGGPATMDWFRNRGKCRNTFEWISGTGHSSECSPGQTMSTENTRPYGVIVRCTCPEAK